ncbi:MAG: ABC transporter transmembrane domain-containing protein [Fibrobacterales bacterium]
MALNSVEHSMFKLIKLLPYFRKESKYMVTVSIGINILMLAMPIALMQVYDRIIPNNSMSTLWWLMIGVVTAVVIEAVMRIVRNMIGNWLSAGYEHELSTRAVNSLVDMSHEEFDEVGPGVHLERLNSVKVLRSYFSGQLFQVLVDLPFVFFFIGIQIMLGGLLVLYTLLLVGLFLGLVFYAARKYEMYIKLYKDINNRHFNYIVETIGGVHAVKSMSMEEQMLRRYESIQESLTAIELKKNFWSNLPKNVSPVLSNMNLLGVISFGAVMVLKGELTLGVMTACTMVATRILQPVVQVAYFWMKKSEAEIAYEQYLQLFSKDEFEPDEEIPLVNDIEGKITIQGLSIFQNNPDYTYSGEIEAGECICIIGRNSGPTTQLVKSLCGILEVDKNTVVIDEYDLSYWRHRHFNGRIEYLSRNGKIFRGTILDNITMFCPENYLIAQDTAALVELDQMVADLPLGYETPVDPASNLTLPHGLIQRICIARALVVRPRILVVDRTIQALDSGSGRILIDVIQKLQGSCTVIVASETVPVGLHPSKVLSCTGDSLIEYKCDAGEFTDGTNQGKVRQKLSREELLSGDVWIRWMMQTATRFEDIEPILQETSIELIDHDHRKIAQYAIEMNLLVGEISTTVNKGLIEKQKMLLENFYEFTRGHFTREEEFIERMNLDGLDKQKKEHREILTTFSEIIEDFRQGRSKITHSLKLSLMDWVISHINNLDYETFRLHTIIPFIRKLKTWKEMSYFIYSTGIPFVDTDHERLTRSLIELACTIGSEMRQKANVEVEDQFDQLYTLAQEILDREEAFLNTYSIDVNGIHRKKHEEFLSLIQECKEGYQEGELNRDGVYALLLGEWIDHSNGRDMVDFSIPHLLPIVLSDASKESDLTWMLRKTGIAEIDTQHLDVITAVMKTTTLDSSTMDPGTLDTTLSGILALVKKHFSYEEKYMESIGESSLKSHKEEHRHILSSIEEYLDNVRKDRIKFSDRFRLRLLDWWVNHTNGTDYQTFILNRVEGE